MQGGNLHFYITTQIRLQGIICSFEGHLGRELVSLYVIYMLPFRSILLQTAWGEQQAGNALSGTDSCTFSRLCKIWVERCLQGVA